MYQDDDGTVVVRGRLAPDVGALLLRALDAARDTLYRAAREPEPRRDDARRRDERLCRDGEPRGDDEPGQDEEIYRDDGIRGNHEISLGDMIQREDVPTMVQQRADALALLAETALHHGLDPGAPGERYQVVVHVDAPVLANPDQPGQSVLEDGARVSAEPSMWRSPLPVPLKLCMLRAWRGQRSVALLVPTELGAEPDPGRFEVPRRVDTARAL